MSRLLCMAREKPLTPLSQQAFRYLYLVSKVRGAKVILRWFSHEVADLQPVLSLLESQGGSQHQVGVSHCLAPFPAVSVYYRRGKLATFCCCGFLSLPSSHLTSASWMETGRASTQHLTASWHLASTTSCSLTRLGMLQLFCSRGKQRTLSAVV